MGKHNVQHTRHETLRIRIPREAFSLAHRAVASARLHLVPPLLPEDVVFLVGENIARKYLYQQLPASDSTSPGACDFDRLDALGVTLTVVANPEYAELAGFLHLRDRNALYEHVTMRYSHWMHAVLGPALGGPLCSDPDTSPRGRMLKAQAQEHFEMAFKPDYEAIKGAVKGAVVGNVGGNEWSAEFREEIPDETVTPWLKLIGDAVELSTSVMTFDRGRLTLDKTAARKALDAALGKGVRLRQQRSLDDPVAPDQELGDCQSDSGQPSPEELTAMAELRDLRDSRDLNRTHPQLDELVESVLIAAAIPGDFTVRLRALLERLLTIKERGLVAAIVYELGGWGCVGHPRWTREAVADTYQVTPRQIERRGKWARQILSEVLAA